jgi:hypothetical protein
VSGADLDVPPNGIPRAADGQIVDMEQRSVAYANSKLVHATGISVPFSSSFAPCFFLLSLSSYLSSPLPIMGKFVDFDA